MRRKRYDRLETEARGPGRPLDRLTPRAMVRRLVAAERSSVAAVLAEADGITALAERAATAIAAGGRLVYVGAGTSGRLATLDAAECPPTFGVPRRTVLAVIAGGRAALTRSIEGAEDRDGEAEGALAKLGVGDRDVVVAIAASGVTPFSLGALGAARARGAFTTLVTCAPRAEHRRLADQIIGLRVGPEVLAGSTRLKAGTATKLCLNALSTTTMALLGKVYEGRMVDVIATNAKLRARALRITQELTRLPAPAARRLLARAGDRPKVAVTMHRLHLDRVGAERALARVGGDLHRLPRGGR